MIVVDTNILIYAEIEGPFMGQVVGLLRRDPNWRVPPLWRTEFSNAMVTMARAGRLADNEALAALRRAQERFGPAEMDVEQVEVLALALDHGVSGYDATFLALARSLDVPLVTEDRALRQKSRGLALSLAEFLDSGFAVSEPAPKYETKIRQKMPARLRKKTARS